MASCERHAINHTEAVEYVINRTINFRKKSIMQFNVRIPLDIKLLTIVPAFDSSRGILILGNQWVSTRLQRIPCIHLCPIRATPLRSLLL